MTKFGDQHNASTYPEMLAHFAEYGNVVGDSTQNLCATSMAANAYMFEHEAKYKDWLIEYVDAWLKRTGANGNNIPSVIGLDGTVGGGWDGKWYGGVYGWGFSPYDPAHGRRANRNTVYRGLRVGFLNAPPCESAPAAEDGQGPMTSHEPTVLHSVCRRFSSALVSLSSGSRIIGHRQV